MKDPFNYTARWNSIGLDCSYCHHESSVEWPNTRRDYYCKLHQISLAATLANSGYKEGEWFCASFEDNGNANRDALSTFNAAKHMLNPTVLYGAHGDNSELKEIPFNEL